MKVIVEYETEYVYVYIDGYYEIQVARIQYYLDVENLQKEEHTENKQYQKRKKINHNK